MIQIFITFFKIMIWFFVGLLIFLDIAKKGFIHNFIFKFIESFPLFIKDFITMDKKEFRGYGFHIYCGLGGSGKTISIVNYLLAMKQKYPKLKIYTNFYFPAGDGIIKDWKDLIEITNYETVEITQEEYEKLKKFKPNKEGKNGEFWTEDVEITNEETGEIETITNYYKIINHGVIFGFDEIHMTLNSDKWKDRPDDLLYYISQQRKMHKQIVASSQVFTRIDKILREQTNYVVECNSFLLGRLVVNRFYHTEEYIANDEKKDKGSRKRKVKAYRIFIARDFIRNSYDTEEIMKDLKVGKSKDKQLVDLIKEYSKKEFSNSDD